MRTVTISFVAVNFAFVLCSVSGTEILHQFVNLGSAETGEKGLCGFKTLATIITI